MEHADALRRPYDTLAALLQCYADEIAIVQVCFCVDMAFVASAGSLTEG